MATKRKLKPRQPARPVVRRNWSPSHRSQQRLFQETFVYVMANLPFFFLCKFGISDKTNQRQRNVSETTPGIVQTILSMNLAFGFEVEQFVHGIYKPLNVHFWTGSGRTEWFIVFSPIVGSVVWWLDHRFGFGLSIKQLAFGFFTPFIWWDGILWVLIFSILKFLFILAAIIFLVYMVAHIK